MASSSDTARPPLNATAVERPKFLLSFPEDKRLNELIELFEEGNFHELRKQVRALDTASVSTEVHQAAQELFRRTEPDPAIKWLLLMCFTLFAIIVGSVYLR